MPTSQPKTGTTGIVAAPNSSEPTTLYLIKQLELAVRAQLDNLLRDSGVTVLQYTALTVLEIDPDVTSAQLARRSFVTSQTMADMIVALETGGFIIRRRDSADRRRLVLNLTRSGQAVLDRYRPAVSAIEASMLGDINAADTARFRQLIMSCRQALLGG